MMIIFAFKKRQLKEKTQDANFSLPIKNPESAIKKTDSGFGFQNWPKNWADSGYGLPTLILISICF